MATALTRGRNLLLRRRAAELGSHTIGGKRQRSLQNIRQRLGLPSRRRRPQLAAEVEAEDQEPEAEAPVLEQRRAARSRRAARPIRGPGPLSSAGIYERMGRRLGRRPGGVRPRPLRRHVEVEPVAVPLETMDEDLPVPLEAPEEEELQQLRRDVAAAEAEIEQLQDQVESKEMESKEMEVVPIPTRQRPSRRIARAGAAPVPFEGGAPAKPIATAIRRELNMLTSPTEADARLGEIWFRRYIRGDFGIKGKPFSRAPRKAATEAELDKRRRHLEYAIHILKTRINEFAYADVKAFFIALRDGRAASVAVSAGIREFLKTWAPKFAGTNVDPKSTLATGLRRLENLHNVSRNKLKEPGFPFVGFKTPELVDSLRQAAQAAGFDIARLGATYVQGTPDNVAVVRFLESKGIAAPVVRRVRQRRLPSAAAAARPRAAPPRRARGGAVPAIEVSGDPDWQLILQLAQTVSVQRPGTRSYNEGLRQLEEKIASIKARDRQHIAARGREAAAARPAFAQVAKPGLGLGRGKPTAQALDVAQISEAPVMARVVDLPVSREPVMAREVVMADVVEPPELAPAAAGGL